ncbi:hypothetical protein ACWC9T_37120 [Kitasatospora sp. NPDC001159]
MSASLCFFLLRLTAQQATGTEVDVLMGKQVRAAAGPLMGRSAELTVASRRRARDRGLCVLSVRASRAHAPGTSCSG